MWGIRSTRIVHADRVESGVVLVQGGKILSVTQTPPPWAEIEDVGDAVVMAGLVDCHVHINEPGRTDWEGFHSATRAALCGGVTTLVDMPLNCSPVTVTPEALRLKLDSLRSKLHVDVGFWAGIVPGNGDQLQALMEAGALGGKAFMCHSGIDEFPASGLDELSHAARIFKPYDAPVLAHAEVVGPVEPTAGGPESYRRYMLSRPPEWELKAIEQLIEVCRETGAPVHIVHLATAEALPMIEAARGEGLPLTVETCPHYLCLEAEEIGDGQTVFKCAPPIRGRENRDGLWEGLRSGLIDFVVSDHSPCPPEMKGLDEGNFATSWGGISSLDLGLPVVWTEAQRRGFGLQDVARWMSLGPSKLPRLDDVKGSLEEGKHADIVVWSPEESVTVRAEERHTRHRLTPYAGRTYKGRVEMTVLGGEVAYRRGNPFGAPLGVPLLRRTTNAD